MGFTQVKPSSGASKADKEKDQARFDSDFGQKKLAIEVDLNQYGDISFSFNGDCVSFSKDEFRKGIGHERLKAKLGVVIVFGDLLIFWEGLSLIGIKLANVGARSYPLGYAALESLISTPGSSLIVSEPNNYERVHHSSAPIDFMYLFSRVGEAQDLLDSLENNSIQAVRLDNTARLFSFLRFVRKRLDAPAPNNHEIRAKMREFRW